MARKKKYIPKAFESAGAPNDTSANLYESMLTSPAFISLTKRQRLLYLYCKSQYYGKRKPSKDFKELDMFQDDACFYMNRATIEKYNLYTKGNNGAFYDDIKELENKGFITRELQGGGNGHTKSVYKFSGKWKEYTPP